jgi:hypothetical protein
MSVFILPSGVRLATPQLKAPGESLVKRTKKAVFLELRKKYLAVGHAVRRYTYVHFFDP